MGVGKGRQGEITGNKIIKLRKNYKVTRTIYIEGQIVKEERKQIISEGAEVNRK